MEETMRSLTINEELKNLLPPLSEEEYTGLEADILERGCLTPLLTWGDILVEGHNRHEICQKHGLSYKVSEIEFDSLDDAKFWAWQHQKNRRNLAPYQRAELALKFKDIVAAKAKERQIRKPASFVTATLPGQKETRQELAEIAGIGSRTLDKAEYIAENADEGTKEKLRRGEKGTSINKEYNRLKDRSEGKQKKLKSEKAAEPSTVLPTTNGNGFDISPQIDPISHDQPDHLASDLLAHYPIEFTEKAVFHIFSAMRKKCGEGKTLPLAGSIWIEFGKKMKPPPPGLPSGLHCRPGEKPGATGEPYVPRTTLKDLRHDRPEILMAQLMAHFPKEYIL